MWDGALDKAPGNPGALGQPIGWRSILEMRDMRLLRPSLLFVIAHLVLVGGTVVIALLSSEPGQIGAAAHTLIGLSSARSKKWCNRDAVAG